MKSLLLYKAGPKILEILRQEGLNPSRVRVFAGPAGGPKWFVSVGFDKSLMASRFLERGERVLLAGSSAGGWRCLAMACKDALSAYEKLRIAYSRNVFTAQDTPGTIRDALRKNVNDFIGDEDIPHILNHHIFNLAVHTVRSKGPAASENKRVEGAALLVAAALNVVSPLGMEFFFERVVFYTGPEKPGFLDNSFGGRAVRLTSENIRQAALATGSLPYIIAGVKDVPGAPPGVYRDGGLRDYQLNEDYSPGEGGVTLFFHYQEKIVPGWFDKPFSWRRPPRGSLDRVLQVYPSEEFVRMLPDGRIPDRADFTTFVDNPSERIRRWDEVSKLSELLGEEFLEDVESGRIRHRVKPMEDPF